MKITITQAAPSPSGLRLGLRVEHEKAGWLRFATTVLVIEELTESSKQHLTDALNKARYRYREDLDDEYQGTLDFT